MDGKCSVDQSVLSDNAPPILRTVNDSAEELPTIMATLVLDESAAVGSLKNSTSFSTDSVFHLRRSQRKQAVPRILAGGVTKSCSIYGRRAPKKDSSDVPMLHRDDAFKKFYKFHTKTFQKPKTKSLETIHEEPEDTNGTKFYSNLRRRCKFQKYQLEHHKSIRPKMFFSEFYKKRLEQEKRYFPVEDVKKHLVV